VDELKKLIADEKALLVRETCGYDTLVQARETERRQLLLETMYGAAYTWGSGVVLTPKQRRQHTHIIGSTQFGKSKFIEHNIRKDILDGTGLLLIDPDGSLFRNVLEFCAHKNIRKVCVIDPNPGGPNPHYVSYNPLKKQPDENYQSCANRVMDAVVTAWHETLDKLPTFQKYVPAIFQLLARTDMTLAEVPDFLYKETTTLRSSILVNVFGQLEDEGSSISPLKTLLGLYQQSVSTVNKELMSAQNRLLNFTTNPNLTNILGQGDNTISIPDLVKQGFVILVNLNPSRWPDTIHLPLILGTLVLNEVMEVDSEKPFHVYIDEVGYFATEKLKTFLSLKLKRNLVLHLAHQYIGQLKQADISKAVFNCTSNKIVFKIPDADDLSYIGKTIFGRADQEVIDYLRGLKEQWAVMSIFGDEPKLAQVPTVQPIPAVNVDDYLNSLYTEYKGWYSTEDQAIELHNIRITRMLGPQPVNPPSEKKPEPPLEFRKKQ